MNESAIVGVDLRSSDLRLAAADADGTVRTWSVPAAAATVGGRLVFGSDAADALPEHPEAGWTGLLSRVGDPVPVPLGAESLPASDLVARIIAAELPRVPQELRVVVPASWGAARRQSRGGCG